MKKQLWITIILAGLISCDRQSEPYGFLNQKTPDNIPLIFAPGFISIKGRLEQGFSVSPDYKEIHFGVIGDNDTLNCIYVTIKNKNKWIKPL